MANCSNRDFKKPQDHVTQTFLGFFVESSPCTGAAAESCQTETRGVVGCESKDACRMHCWRPPTLDWVCVSFVLFVRRRMRSRVRPCWNVALTERVLVYSKEPAAGNKDVAVSKKPEVL